MFKEIYFHFDYYQASVAGIVSSCIIGHTYHALKS